MDKDKLIKEAERMWHKYCGDIYDDNFYWSFYWLIHQARRVQELEQQNKRLREALEFYANEDLYNNINIEYSTYDEFGNRFFKLEGDLFSDGGEKARKALEG